jgi:hypothetical protein
MRGCGMMSAVALSLPPLKSVLPRGAPRLAIVNDGLPDDSALFSHPNP